jgi:hypothetical protein
MKTNSPQLSNVLCCILTTHKHSSRIAAIKQSWGESIDHLFYSDHESISDNILKVSQRSDYHSNEDKHLNCLNLLSFYLNDMFGRFEWLFFCDDDTFVNTRRLLDFANSAANKNIVYGERITQNKDFRNLVFHKRTVPSKLSYLSGGAGYLMSTKIYEQMYPFSNFNTGFSDVSMGINILNAGITIENMPLMHSQPPSFYNHEASQINDNISYHYIKESMQMKTLHMLASL